MSPTPPRYTPADQQRGLERLEALIEHAKYTPESKAEMRQALKIALGQARVLDRLRAELEAALASEQVTEPPPVSDAVYGRRFGYCVALDKLSRLLREEGVTE